MKKVVECVFVYGAAIDLLQDGGQDGDRSVPGHVASPATPRRLCLIHIFHSDNFKSI